MSIFMQDLPWHDGETTMQKAMRAPTGHNPTIQTLSPQLANHLQVAPLIALGTLDKQGRPWTTLWGNGDKGFAQPMGQGVMGIRTPVVGKHDPVVEELFGTEANGEIVREEGKGKMVGGLTIDLETRKRVKLYGRMAAGALGPRKEDEVTGKEEVVVEAQFVVKIEQSMGNCPKYINKKAIVAGTSKPEIVEEGVKLGPKALELLEKADMFFISSSQGMEDMDTNHRGGPPGLVRVVSNDASGAVIVYPEYSGNRLYQTLGNFKVNPKAGMCIPDYETGDMLYLTGDTTILIGRDAAAVLPRSNLAVQITITSARFVSTALPFRGVPGERSPYNPNVRYLTSEKPPTSSVDAVLQQATLLSQIKLTPTISRFRFSLNNAATYKPGQYVTLDFSEQMDMGYSHMRDDDPRSINDDFVRTFTVSSLPGTPPDPVQRLKDDEFEITIRKVGAATNFLFQREGKLSGKRGIHDLEVGVKGFGGEFEVQQRDGEGTIGFITAGVGVTPILPSLYTLDFKRLKIFWSTRKADLGLLKDTFDQHPGMLGSVVVFVTDAKEGDEAEVNAALGGHEVKTKFGRMSEEDLDMSISRYYLCTPIPMRKQVIAWLPGKELIFEDFNF